MGNTHCLAAFGGLALIVVGACEPARPGPGYPAVDCIVDDDVTAPLGSNEQALVRIPAPAIEFVLEEDSGGPLRCRPSQGDCVDFDGCIGAPVPVPVGSTATVAVGVRTIESTGIRVVFDEVSISGDPAFQLLQPTLSTLEPGDDDEGAFFLAVTPEAEGIIVAELHIGSDARNMEFSDARSITLQIEGVQP